LPAADHRRVCDVLCARAPGLGVAAPRSGRQSGADGDERAAAYTRLQSGIQAPGGRTCAPLWQRAGTHMTTRASIDPVATPELAGLAAGGPPDDRWLDEGAGGRRRPGWGDALFLLALAMGAWYAMHRASHVMDG